jgi:spoIIIJ-associated protein
MSKTSVSKIREIVEDFLTKAGFTDFKVETTEPSAENGQASVLNIVTQADSKFLIGQHGDNLRALQHLMRLIVRKAFPDQKIGFVLDINNYREQKEKVIIEVAREAAREAAKDKKAVFLRPMSAYERRIVHMTLAKDQQVVTESVGEGTDRRIVIKAVSYTDSVD